MKRGVNRSEHGCVMWQMQPVMGVTWVCHVANVTGVCHVANVTGVCHVANVTWVCHVANAVCDGVTWGGSCGRYSVKYVSCGCVV